MRSGEPFAVAGRFLDSSICKGSTKFGHISKNEKRKKNTNADPM